MPVARVVVLDHGSGNVRSVVRALEAAGAQVELTADRERALAADGLVVPGVGAFAATIAQIHGVGGDRLIERRLAGGRPVLGICVGLQVMFETGDRARRPHPGAGTVARRGHPPGSGRGPPYGLEHGRPRRRLAPCSRASQGERFYFVHSYAARRWEMEQIGSLAAPLVTWAEHGGDRFIAAVENGALTATQFHPEKSGDAGARLLANWLHTLPRYPVEAVS